MLPAGVSIRMLAWPVPVIRTVAPPRRGVRMAAGRTLPDARTRAHGRRRARITTQNRLLPIRWAYAERCGGRHGYLCTGERVPDRAPHRAAAARYGSGRRGLRD